MITEITYICPRGKCSKLGVSSTPAIKGEHSSRRWSGSIWRSVTCVVESASLQILHLLHWTLADWLPGGHTQRGHSSGGEEQISKCRQFSFTPRCSICPITSRSVPAKVAPRRLQFFNLAFFKVATRRFIPVIWLPSMSTPFRLAPGRSKNENHLSSGVYYSIFNIHRFLLGICNWLIYFL